MAWIHPPAIGCRFSFLHIPCGRCGHTSVMYQNFLLIFGGFDGKRWLNDLHSFDTTSLVWSQPKALGSFPTPRQYHTACQVKEAMYIFGGYNGVGWLKDFIVLDTLNFKWTYPRTLGNVPMGREGHTMINSEDFLYVYGGWDGGTIGDMFRININDFVWEKIEFLGDRPLLCGHSMNKVDNDLFIFGGFDGMNWVNSLYKVSLETFYCEKLSTKGEPIPRGYHSATLVNRYILIYAGYNGRFILGDLVALDTENLVWSLPDPCLGHFPTARNAHTVTILGSELFMFGGYNGTRDTNDLHILETSAFSTLQDDLRVGIDFSSGNHTEVLSKNQVYLIHSVILQARCPLLLQDDYRQSLNLSKPAMDVFIEYLYCDISSEKITKFICEELIEISEKLKLERLKALCEDQVDPPDSSLTTDITNIKTMQHLSDFKIVVESTEFFLHKVILASRCPYFRAMFQSGMSENAENQMFLDYFTVQAFEFIVEWIYSDKFVPLLGENSVNIDVFIQILIQTNMLGLEGLMRMAEIASEEAISMDNVVKLYEVAHSLGAIRLKSYTINFILREYDNIAVKRDLQSLNDAAFEDLNNYLPRRIKRQSSKNGIFPSLNLIKFDKNLILKNNLKVKPHDPKSSRLPSRELQGTISMRNPLNNFSSRILGNCSSPQPRKQQLRRQNRAYTYQTRETKNLEPPDFIVQGVSPRSNNSTERTSVLQQAGMHISSSLTSLYQHTFGDGSFRSRFLLYK